MLDLLAQNIPPGYHLEICDRSDDDIRAIRQNLGFGAERLTDMTAFNGGFTDLLKADQLERWLDLPPPGQPLS